MLILTGAEEIAMRRRELLAVASTATVGSTAGCGRILGTACEPADSALGPLYDSVLDMGDPGDILVRGTIKRATPSELVIADATGYASVNSTIRSEFNTSVLSSGGCAEFKTSVQADYSREYGNLSLLVRYDEDIDTLGDTNDPPDGPPTEPDTFFDTEFVGEGIRLTHREGSALPAKNLEVRSQAKTDLKIYTWEEIADVSGETLVEQGDTTTFDKSGRLIWSPERYWGRAVSSAWTL